MTLTNPYCTAQDVKTELGETSVDYDAKIETSINAASRWIDKHCGRIRHGFWQDATVVTRTFCAESPWCCDVLDISTSTGLIVKTDTGLDGTYATTLTLGTHFRLAPSDADKDYPVRPWDRLEILRTSSDGYFPTATYGFDPVQVTAKFGWPAIPDDVKKACILRAIYEFKASDITSGATGVFGDSTGGITNTAAALLESYVKQYV